jgi:hypothetical protein
VFSHYGYPAAAAAHCAINLLALMRLRRGEASRVPPLALRVEVFQTLDEPRTRLWREVYDDLFLSGGRYLGTFDRQLLARTHNRTVDHLRYGPGVLSRSGAQSPASVVDDGSDNDGGSRAPAAGGAKGLVLLPLDRFLFGHWLPQSTQTVHLLGASIGAWRMAAACVRAEGGADAALAELAEDYITQSYPHAPGRMPTAAVVSEHFQRKLQQRLGARAAEVLTHPRYRLHVFTSRGRGLLHRPVRLRHVAARAPGLQHDALQRRLVDRPTLALPVRPVRAADVRAFVPLESQPAQLAQMEEVRQAAFEQQRALPT